jgi:hypothetical protein
MEALVRACFLGGAETSSWDLQLDPTDSASDEEFVDIRKAASFPGIIMSTCDETLFESSRDDKKSTIDVISCR